MKTPATALNKKEAVRSKGPVYKYRLEPFRVAGRKFPCPSCGRKRKFTHYIDVTTGDRIDPTVGRCDREVECGYHKRPSEHFGELNPHFVKPGQVKEDFVGLVFNRPSVVDAKFLIDSLSDYEDNAFVQFLMGVYPKEQVLEVCRDYFIGTRPKWRGSTIFWMISHNNEIRTGKIMKYGEDGKRVKKPFDMVTWIHNLYSDFNLEQCLFGSHLVTEYTKEVEIVESEKTAVICALEYPDKVWLATGGLQNIQPSKFDFLKGKTLNFHPDQGALETWNTKISDLDFTLFHGVNVSDELESNPMSGADLADIILTQKQ